MKIISIVLRALCLAAAGVLLWLCVMATGILLTIIEISYGDQWSRGLVMAYLVPSIFIVCVGTAGALFGWLGIAPERR